MDKLKFYLNYSQTNTVVGIILMFFAIFDYLDTALERFLKIEIGLPEGLFLLGLFHITRGIVSFMEE